MAMTKKNCLVLLLTLIFFSAAYARETLTETQLDDATDEPAEGPETVLHRVVEDSTMELSPDTSAPAPTEGPEKMVMDMMSNNASGEQFNLAGNWETCSKEGCWTANLVQNGSTITGTYVQIEDQLIRNFGFSLGERALQLEVRNASIVIGMMDAHFRAEWRQKCPGEWERSVGIQLSIESSDLMVGHWDGQQIRENCEVTPSGEVDITLQRVSDAAEIGLRPANNGTSSVDFPDTGTPGPPGGPIPIPYPNTGTSKDSPHGDKKVPIDISPVKQ
jgi:hypothetical protein